jgi:hypothetical protein
MTHLTPCPTIVAAIQIDVIDGRDSDVPDDYDAIREAWDGRRLRLTDPWRLHEALRVLANDMDETSRAREQGMDADEQRFLGRASRALYRLLDKIYTLALVSRRGGHRPDGSDRGADRAARCGDRGEGGGTGEVQGGAGDTEGLDGRSTVR